MILINLLPYREEARKRVREGFYTNMAIAALLGVAISVVIWFALSQLQSRQDDRNRFLANENAQLDEKIAQISNLKAEIAALQARKTAVENLQSDRNLVVHWLEDLAKLTPDGIYLTKAQQSGLELTVNGVTLSNDQVSEFLARTAPGKSSWVANSQWIGAIQVTNMSLSPSEPPRRLFTFTMRFDLVRDPPESNAGASADNNSPTGQPS